MPVYSIIRQSTGFFASQVSKVPKTLFAVSIKPFVPAILHPLVLWTQVVPPLEYGTLVASTLVGDKMTVSFSPSFQQIEFTSEAHIPLEINIHSDFNKLMSVSRVYHLYALGEECVDRVYNAQQYTPNYTTSKSSKHVPLIYDIEELKKLK